MIRVRVDQERSSSAAALLRDPSTIIAVPLTHRLHCGGIPGFYETLHAIADPEHPDHDEAAEYFDEFDPREIDELGIKYALARIANRRNSAAARLAKKKSVVTN